MGGNKEGSGSRKQERRVNEVREEWERGRRAGEWSRRRQRGKGKGATWGVEVMRQERGVRGSGV